MFFFPISDDNHSTIRPYVSYCIIALCCFIFLWQSTLPVNLYKDAIFNFGVIPAALLGDQPGFINPYITIFTSMFMHGSWMHLLGNMVFLWIFGDNIEDSMGHKKFLLFYLICGLLAAFLQALIDPASTAPMIGASGAIAGILGAYLILHPDLQMDYEEGLFIGYRWYDREKIDPLFSFGHGLSYASFDLSKINSDKKKISKKNKKK